MTSPTFQCPIQMQPKLAVMAPGIFLAVMIIGGWAITTFGKRAALSQGTMGGLYSALVFLAIIGVVVAVVGGKGQVEVRPDAVVVARGVTGSVTLPRAGAEYTLTRWRSYVHFASWLEAGPQLEIRSQGRSVTVACLGPELARGLPGSGAFLMDLPAAVIAKEDFQALIASLDLVLPPAPEGG
jgi:hypothetical protein